MLELVARALLSGLTLGGVYALIALGLSIIFGVMDIINLAHGQLVVLSGYIAYWAFRLALINPLASLPLVALAMAGVGLGIYMALIKKVRGEEALTTLILTYGLGVFLTDLMLLAWTADYRTIRVAWLERPVGLGIMKASLGEWITLAISVSLMLGVYVFLTKTRVGKAIRAVSQDREAAALMGIDITKIEALSFCLGLGVGGVAGALFTTLYYIFPGLGGMLTTLGFVVTVLAGVGNIPGIVIGGIVLGVAEMLTSAFISPEIQHMVSFIVFIIILLVKHR